MTKDSIKLTKEQIALIDAVKNGDNVLCDACWGSGKTTTLIKLNEVVSCSSKNVLYLTYNRELKEEARKKFNSSKNNIHNYDAFASMILRKNNIPTSFHDSDIIVESDKINLIPSYDILLIDEYQDINRNHSLIIQQLLYKNPDLQIIAVGDRDQKISNKSSINALEFFKSLFKQSNRNLKELALTNSFRLNSTIAKFLSNVYNKKVVGKNDDLEIDFIENNYDIAEILSEYEPNQILILGGNYGDAKRLQNILETTYPKKFNKDTIYSSISEKDTDNKVNTRHNDICLDITYDTCKGLEKDVVVLCDFSESYWKTRTSHNDYGIVKNLFSVALTRAKKKLIIKETYDNLTPQSLKTATYKSDNRKSISVNDLIRFKPSNYIMDALNCLEINEIQKASSEIEVIKHDKLIDTSFIIGEYIEANYFENYSVDKKIELFNDTHQDYQIKVKDTDTVMTKLKALAAGLTCQNRYRKANINISEDKKRLINNRIKSEFSKNYTDIEIACNYYFKEDDLTLKGIQDAIKNNIVYEFKFESQIKAEDILQCGTYMFMTGRKLGILWNIQDDSKYEIKIKNIKQFKSCLRKLITYTGDKIETHTSKIKLNDSLKNYLEC